VDALFLDLTPDKEPTQGEKRKRELQQLIRRGRKPVALFVDVSPIRQKLALLNSSKGEFRRFGVHSISVDYRYQLVDFFSDGRRPRRSVRRGKLPRNPTDRPWICLTGGD
jgi:hypothetical protein